MFTVISASRPMLENYVLDMGYPIHMVEKLSIHKLRELIWNRSNYDDYDEDLV